MSASSETARSTENIRTVNEPAVVAQDLGKVYAIDGAGAEGAGRKLGRRAVRYVDALRNVTFVAERGESIGIVGRNGSGKSTLLRMIAGTEAPSSGKVSVSHQPSLLGVTPALQGWLTGEQNIYLGLLALGMGPSEAAETVPGIVDWAELGEAATRPMSTYSSGMGAKLSFAISTAIKPEILLIDETLSTGDAAFADKAKKRMENLIHAAGNIFLVSHSISTVQENCSRAIWIHQGDVIADADVDLIVSEYNRFSDLLRDGKTQPANDLLLEVSTTWPRQVVTES